MNNYVTKKEVQEKLNQYIDNLILNQKNTNASELQNVFPRENYYLLLRNVLELIKENRFASISSLRLKLIKKSGINELVKELVYDTEITPGLVLKYGTQNYQDTIVSGYKQEGIKINDKIMCEEAGMEYNTIFDLASTSKIFTSLAIYLLVDGNYLNLDDKITNYAPEFKYLNDVTIKELLTFSKRICTRKRIDMASSPLEAEQILYSAYIPEDQNLQNAYTDMGAMVLKCLVEDITHMAFTEFVQKEILNVCDMKETFLYVPNDYRQRCANENYSTIINMDGKPITRMDNYPGTAHDPKANALGHEIGIASGHAGYFSTADDMLKLANALENNLLIKKDSLWQISNNFVGKPNKDSDDYSYYYGSLVYLKQPNAKHLSVYYPLSGKSFMSPGFAGTTLCIDPLNNISLFIGANRLHNRVYSLPKDYLGNVKTNDIGKQTYILPNGTEKVVSANFTRAKEKLVHCALDLALEFQFLELYQPGQQEINKERNLSLKREI